MICKTKEEKKIVAYADFDASCRDSTRAARWSDISV